MREVHGQASEQGWEFLNSMVSGNLQRLPISILPGGRTMAPSFTMEHGQPPWVVTECFLLSAGAITKTCGENNTMVRFKSQPMEEQAFHLVKEILPAHACGALHGRKIRQ